jgi:hypothetical protein
MRQKNIDKFVDQVIALEEEEAKEVGALGYMARILVQATLPHSKPNDFVFERTNGKFNLAITSHPKVGLPYGVYPRLLLSWMVTEAVRTKKTQLILGENLSQFMKGLGLIPSGGRWGTISRLGDQMKRLFSSSISCTYEDESRSSGLGFNIAKEYNLWWDPKQPEQADIWHSTVTLGQDFFNEIINKPIPIDMRAIKLLKTSSMALDLYCWLTYRLFYLKNKVEIPWPLLQKQFGCDYANTKQGRYEFKRQLLTQLKKIHMLCKGAEKIQEGSSGLILIPRQSRIRKS